VIIMEAGDSWFTQIKVLFQNAGNVFVLLRNKISALPHPQDRMRRRNAGILPVTSVSRSELRSSGVSTAPRTAATVFGSGFSGDVGVRFPASHVACPR
jgi:hypothetical protein